MSKPSKIRLSLDVTPEFKTRIDGIQAKSHATTTIEVFRKALSLYELVLDQYASKGRIALENDDGTREILRLL